jgi:hypothetical protein
MYQYLRTITLNESVYQELKNGMENLQKNIDKTAANSCARIAIEVLKDTKVQDAIIELLNQDYIFDQLSCERFGIDQTKVTFMFKCRPPKICFIHPGIIVTYDHSLHQVVDIQRLFF